jgi:hypothetical protein
MGSIVVWSVIFAFSSWMNYILFGEWLWLEDNACDTDRKGSSAEDNSFEGAIFWSDLGNH